MQGGADGEGANASIIAAGSGSLGSLEIGLAAVCGSFGFECRPMSLVKIVDVSDGFFAGWALGSCCDDVEDVVEASGPSEGESSP